MGVGSEDSNLRFMVNHTLNSHIFAYQNFISNLKETQSSNLTWYDTTSLTTLLVQVGIALIMVVLSIISYFTTRKNLQSIYDVLLSRRIADFEVKIEVLEKLKLLLKCLNKEFLCANILQSKIMNETD